MKPNETKKAGEAYILLPLNDKEQKRLAEFAKEFMAPNEHPWILRFNTLASANLKIPSSIKQLVSMPDRFIPEIIKAAKLARYDTLYKKFFSLGRQMSFANEPFDIVLTLIGLQMISLMSIVEELKPEKTGSSQKSNGNKKSSSIDLKEALPAFSKLQHNLRLAFLQSYFQIFNAHNQVRHEDLQRIVEKSNIRQNQEKLLRKILVETAQYLDFQQLFMVFSKSIRDTCKYDRVSVALLTENPNEVQVFAVSTNGESKVKAGFTIQDDCSLIPAIKSKKTKITADTFKNKGCKVCAQLNKEGMNSFIITPMIVDDVVIGTLNIASTKLAFFSDGDVQFLQELASGLAVSVKNSMNHSKIIETLKYEQCASDLISKIHSTLDSNELKKIVCRELVHCTEADRVFFAELREPEAIGVVEHEFLNPKFKGKELLSAIGTYQIEKHRAITEILRKGEVIAANLEGEVHPALKEGIDDHRALGSKSLCFVPIFVFGKYWGIVGINHCFEPYTWKKEQIEMLKKVVKEISKAIELAHTHQEEKNNVKRLEKIIKEK